MRYYVYPCIKPKVTISLYMEIDWPVEVRKDEVIELNMNDLVKSEKMLVNKEYWVVDHVVHKSVNNKYIHTVLYVTPVRT